MRLFSRAALAAEADASDLIVQPFLAPGFVQRSTDVKNTTNEE